MCPASKDKVPYDGSALYQASLGLGGLVHGRVQTPLTDGPHLSGVWAQPSQKRSPGQKRSPVRDATRVTNGEASGHLDGAQTAMET